MKISNGIMEYMVQVSLGPIQRIQTQPTTGSFGDSCSRMRLSTLGHSQGSTPRQKMSSTITRTLTMFPRNTSVRAWLIFALRACSSAPLPDPLTLALMMHVTFTLHAIFPLPSTRAASRPKDLKASSIRKHQTPICPTQSPYRIGHQVTCEIS